jgi:protein-glutamine gamma-glutamyltransferase
MEVRAVRFTDRYTLPILGAVVVCTLPHFPYVSAWVVLVCLFLWIYIAAAVVRAWRLPSAMVTRLLAALLFIAAMTTHEGLSIEAFVALLAIMVGMKLLETRNHRDRMMTVILCYFLVAGGMFFGDSIAATLYKLFSILCITAVLIHVNHPGGRALNHLQLAVTLLVQAIPLALILFLVFPRVQGGIWGRGHLNLARTGFSDALFFGDVAELATSTEVAFRVEFAGATPPQDKLYWRGVVLWRFDGRSWTRGMDRRGRLPAYSVGRQPVRYTVTLEPHNEHWLFALDLPVRIDLRHAWLLNDHSGYRWRPITGRVMYEAVSRLDGEDAARERSTGYGLQLPEKGNPRARALAESLFRQAGSDTDYVRAVLDYFREQPFYYTLQPTPLRPIVGEDPAEGESLVDRFLFGSRRGFCEHFAGSFAFLMRAAGVPARVVAGYQGGERNQYGGYLVVRQSDAHAWCEVWLAETGWIRVDPTGVVAPDRLRTNVAGALPPGESAGLLSLSRYGIFGQWLGNTLGMMDYWNNRWNRWVMGYSAGDQQRVFFRLGIRLDESTGWAQGLLIILVLAAAGIVLFSVVLLYQPKPGRDEIAAAWNDFCLKLAGIGLPRRPGQGPVDYLRYVAGQRPDLAPHVKKIVSSYVRIRYGNSKREIDVSILLMMIKRFSPKKN